MWEIYYGLGGVDSALTRIYNGLSCGVNNLKSNKFWIISLCLIILAAAVAAVLTMRTQTAQARIYHEGILINEINLSHLTGRHSLTVGGVNGFNFVEFERGRIRVLYADCPDGTCVAQGWISGGMMPIVCLPHRLVIRLEGNNEPDIDAVVG